MCEQRFFEARSEWKLGLVGRGVGWDGDAVGGVQSVEVWDAGSVIGTWRRELVDRVERMTERDFELVSAGEDVCKAEGLSRVWAWGLLHGGG